MSVRFDTVSAFVLKALAVSLLFSSTTVCTGASLFDFDGDHDLDLDDFGRIQRCFNGPQQAPDDPECLELADLDGDGDVDSVDLDVFWACMQGPAIPFDPGCLERPAAVGERVLVASDTPEVIVLEGRDASRRHSLSKGAGALSFVVTTPPQHGALSGNPPLVIYTPAPGYQGPDSFRFVVTEEGKTSVEAVVEIVVSAWHAPIGIPDPGFGILERAPARPAGWPSTPVPGNYCIDNTHPNATDTNNTHGTPDRPRLTFPGNMWDLGPGSLVEIHGGPYDKMSWVRHASGTAASPAFIHGTDFGNKVKIRNGMRLEDSSYLIFENIDWDGNFSEGQGNGVRIIGEGDHLCIRNCEFQDVEAAGSTCAVGITPAGGKTISGVVIYNNLFRDCGDWTREDDVDSHGVAPNLWGRDSTAELKNIWVIDNEFYHLSGNGVQVNAGNWTESFKYLHHVYIGRNIGHHNRQAPFWSKQASHVIMSQNRAYGSRKHGPQMGDGFGNQYNPSHVWYLYNEVYDCNYGFRQSDTTGGISHHPVFYIGNVIHDIHPEPGLSYSPTNAWRPGVAISLWHGDQSRYIINNTIYDVESGIQAIYPGPLLIDENIITGINAEDAHISVSTTASASQTELYTSVLHLDGGGARIYWGSEGMYTSLADFQAAHPEQGTGAIELDPLLKFDVYGIGMPDKGSPAVDTGIESLVYQYFEYLYGLDITMDWQGAPRPQSGNWDLGAIELPQG